MSKRNWCIYLIGLLLFLHSAANAQVRELKDLKDIAYAWDLHDYEGNPQDSLRLDIYYPRGATSNKKYPMILNCHAGSFTGGTKLGQTSNSVALADEGFIVVALDYRTGYHNTDTAACTDDTLGLNEAIYRATQDGNACMRFLHAYSDSFSIDTSNMFLMGNSAGGDLTLHMQYVTDDVAKSKYPYAYATEGGIQSTGNTFPNTYHVKALSVMWGALPNWNLITPETAVPSILYKGGQDPGLPPDSLPYRGVGFYKRCPNYAYLIAGVGIFKAMATLGVTCIYHFQPLGYHAAYDEEFTSRSTACFFREVMQGILPTSAEYTYYDGLCP